MENSTEKLGQPLNTTKLVTLHMLMVQIDKKYCERNSNRWKQLKPAKRSRLVVARNETHHESVANENLGIQSKVVFLEF